MAELLVHRTSTPQVRGSNPGLGKVDSAFNPFGGSRQTDHLTGTPAHAPQSPWSRILGMGLNSGEDVDVCKCIVPLRHGGTLNSRQAASRIVRWGKGKEGGRPLTSQVFSLKTGAETSQIVLSPV
ncbi:hypothetical protein TNCV_1205811 [Trichonephila clavipes]|nr:hypothetical protein TNCV_1205811 [Trichonephila clavipes]